MRLSFDPLYDSTLAGTLITFLVVGLLLVVTPRAVSTRQRWILFTLRAMAGLAMIAVLLRPALIRQDNRPAAATLAIGIDTSLSMTLASGDDAAGMSGGGTTSNPDDRWMQQQRVIDTLSSDLSSLDENLRISLIGYDSTSRSLAGGVAGELPQMIGVLSTLTPEGKTTDLSGPLRMAMNAARSSPLAGIVLLSDGTQTVLDSSSNQQPVKTSSANSGNSRAAKSGADPTSAAKLVGAMGVPLWAVALGPPSDAARTRDVAIEGLPETYRMFSGNETTVSFQVLLRGLVGKNADVSLSWVPESGQSKIAATRRVSASQPEEAIAVEVPLIAPEPGEYRLVVQCEAFSGESVISNNAQAAFVDVREGGGRVLYLEGMPRLEQTFLRRALRRFPDLELNYRWIPRDTVRRWPVELAGDLKRGRYDVIILGDLHSAALGEKQLRDLAESVSEGTALVTLGGEHAYGPGGYGDSPLANAFPVKLDAKLMQPAGPSQRNRNEAGDSEKLPGQSNRAVTLQLAADHPITTIDVPDTKWESLPPMPGANAWLGTKVAPGVRVLLTDDNRQPMMVVGEYGKGRVVSLAFDATWMWWRGGASEFHRRFWRQLMLWVLSREETDTSQIELEMSRRRYASTESSQFTATYEMKRPAGSETDADWRLVATVVDGSGKTTEVIGKAVEQVSDGRRVLKLSGDLTDLPPGFHRLRVAAVPSGGQGGADVGDELVAELPFQVIDDTRELSAATADHALLKQLAGFTKNSGGDLFRPDQLGELADRIRSQRRRAEKVVIEKFRLGDDPLSAWLVFVVFAAALAVEWWLRRRWGLA